MHSGTEIKIGLDQTQEVVCEICEHKFFHQSLYMRKASGLLTGTGKTSFIPIPVFACDKCNHVNREFLPMEVQKLE